MESVKQPIKVFKAQREGSGNAPHPEIVAKIFAPEPTEGEADFSCLVECHALLGTPKKIIGVDADQATELAAVFIEKIFAAKGFGIALQGAGDGPTDNSRS